MLSLSVTVVYRVGLGWQAHAKAALCWREHRHSPENWSVDGYRNWQGGIAHRELETTSTGS